MKNLGRLLVGVLVCSCFFVGSTAMAEDSIKVPLQRIVFVPILSLSEEPDLQLYGDVVFAEAMAWLGEIPGVEVVSVAEIQQFLEIPDNAAMYRKAKSVKDLRDLVLRINPNRADTFIYGVSEISEINVDEETRLMMKEMGVEDEIYEGEQFSVAIEVIEIGPQGPSVSSLCEYSAMRDGSNFVNAAMGYGRDITASASVYIQQQTKQLLAPIEKKLDRLGDRQVELSPEFTAEELSFMDRMDDERYVVTESDKEIVKSLRRKKEAIDRNKSEMDELKKQGGNLSVDTQKIYDSWYFLDRTQIEKEQAKISQTAARAFCDAFAAPTPQKQIEKFTLAILEGRKDASVYIWRAQAFGACGRMDEAMSDINKAIELSPNRSAAYLLRGIASAQLNNIDGSLKDLDRALQINPACINVYLLRAKIYLAQQKGEQALDEMNKAVSMQPKNHVLLLEQVQLLYQLKQFKESLAALERVKKLGADVPAEFESMVRAAAESVTD